MFDPQTATAFDFAIYSFSALAIVHSVSILSSAILKWVFLGEAVMGFKAWADAEKLQAVNAKVAVNT